MSLFLKKYYFKFKGIFFLVITRFHENEFSDYLERFNLKYIGQDGKEHHPLILHTSPSGSIERIVYGILEQANKDKSQGKKPHLPLWLTPVQVRLIPIQESFTTYCQEIGTELDKFGIRNEIDDRTDTLNKRIRSAEKMWIPYICVIGEKEKSRRILTVRRREEDDQIELKIGDLAEEINEKKTFAPRQRIMFPKLISKQAIFSRLV